jgi:hypothetical protein
VGDNVGDKVGDKVSKHTTKAKPMIGEGEGRQESWTGQIKKYLSPQRALSHTTPSNKNNNSSSSNNNNNREELAKFPWMFKDDVKPNHRHYTFDSKISCVHASSCAQTKNAKTSALAVVPPQEWESKFNNPEK